MAFARPNTPKHVFRVPKQPRSAPDVLVRMIVQIVRSTFYAQRAMGGGSYGSDNKDTMCG